MPDGSDLGDLAVVLRRFAADRDWQTFHTPKNLAMAVVAEAGELVAEFQWLTAAESQGLVDGGLDRVADEMADVLIYLVRLADVLGVDLVTAAMLKVERNRARFPANVDRVSPLEDE